MTFETDSGSIVRLAADFFTVKTHAGTPNEHVSIYKFKDVRAVKLAITDDMDEDGNYVQPRIYLVRVIFQQGRYVNVGRYSEASYAGLLAGMLIKCANIYRP